MLHVEGEFVVEVGGEGLVLFCAFRGPEEELRGWERGEGKEIGVDVGV